jgi:hypothetical protein
MLAGGLLISLADSLLDIYVSNFENFSFAFIIANLLIYSLMIYQRELRYPLKSRNFWLFDLYVSHIFISLGYSSLIAFLSPTWIGVWLTIILILHSIIMLFNSTKANYQSLLKLAVIYFVLASIKLFWRDMAGFQTVQKVIVFMVIGVLMLLGSFLFMKYKEKKEEV